VTYRLKISLVKPSDELKDIVKHYLIIESFDIHKKLWILPSAGNFILFNPGLEALLHKYDSDEEVFTLPKDSSVAIKANNIVRLRVGKKNKMTYPLFGIELLPAGCNRLFPEKTTDLTSVYSLLHECIKEKDVTFDELYNLTTRDEQINYIQEGLLSLKEKASPVVDTCKNVENVIAYIEKTLHKVNVSDILREFDYSRTSLERDFKKIVGQTPKEFIQAMRFRLIFKDLMTNGYNFMKLEYDFFDQSHMNKAFKKFIDIPPSKLQSYVQDNNIQIYQLNAGI